MIPKKNLQLLPQELATCLFNPIIPDKKAYYRLLAVNCLVVTLAAGTLLAASVKILVGAAATLSVILIGSLARGILFRYLAENHYKLALKANEEPLQFDHFKKAADLGHRQAQFKVGELYENLEKSLEAFKYYKKAADQGHPEALYNVGYSYEEKGDHQKALHYYLQAEAKGVVESYARIGNFYANGNAGEKNYEKAIEYYRIGVVKNDPVARMNLAHLYITGDGFKKNIQKGIKCYEKVMQIAPHPFAAYNLAKYYERGDIITKDLNESIRYYFKAAKLKDRKAINFLRSLPENDFRYGRVNYRLGKIYQEKENVSDTIRAIYHYEIAVASNHQQFNSRKKIKECFDYLQEEAEAHDEIATNYLHEYAS